jgi:hypothetical protein
MDVVTVEPWTFRSLRRHKGLGYHEMLRCGKVIPASEFG